jgi:hypothetical protein
MTSFPVLEVKTRRFPPHWEIDDNGASSFFANHNV